MNLTDKIFHDDEAARLHLEAQRWPDGAYCPHCGEAEKVTLLQGKSTRPGVYICKSCRTKFTVTVGTIFERSHIGLAKWMMAFRLMAASKKGVSAHQLHRMLGVTYKSAWFMAHRIREAMADTAPKPCSIGPAMSIRHCPRCRPSPLFSRTARPDSKKPPTPKDERLTSPMPKQS